MSIIIGIDHGYYAIKTAHCSFPAGLTSYGEHEPYTRQGLLEFGGCFFVCGSGRQPIQRDKTINDNYYLLTLAAIAKEIRQRGLPPECSVRIAAGLPLTSFGRDKPKFKDYTLTTGCQQGTVEVRPVKNPIKSDLARNTERTGKPGAPMHTLTTKDRHGVLYEGRIRRLTPRECLRLQGWADDRIDTVLAIQSDNQAYKQAGNGVTVHVVEAIGRRIAAMDAELRGEALAP